MKSPENIPNLPVMPGLAIPPSKAVSPSGFYRSTGEGYGQWIFCIRRLEMENSGTC